MSQSLKILMVNWRWYRVAGDWTYVDNLKSLYERYGHEVIPFSTKSSMNDETKGYEKYFVEFTDFRELNKKKNIINGVKAFSKSIYSGEAKKNLEALLSDHKIDVAHLHDVNHYITPSILPVLKKHKIPIIWTLHDYTLICPESTFISDGKICENCKGGKFYHCALQKCKKKSFLASSLAALENTVHGSLNLFRHVDYFLCPSAFLFKKHTEFGFHTEKLVLSNLCCEMPIPARTQKENYILYAGRLAKVKGIITLLKSIKGLDVILYVAGEGPEAATIQSFIAENQIDNVRLLGFKSKNDVYALMQNAQFVVCPSEWYENFPYSVIESMLLKTPVIASSIGGIPELVIHGETGLLVEPFNYLDLQEKILMLLNDAGLREALAEKAYTRTQSIVNFKNHHSVLKNVYADLGLEL